MLQHKGTVTIETIRLILRKFERTDANDMFHNWASDPEVCKYLSWGPHKDISASKKRIKYILQSYSYPDTYQWAIVLKNRKHVIGSISVEIKNTLDSSCEIGYCIGREFWNQGIMTEALRAVMHYLFYEIGYQKIVAKHDLLNPASGRVMQKAGMKFTEIIEKVGIRTPI